MYVGVEVLPRGEKERLYLLKIFFEVRGEYEQSMLSLVLPINSIVLKKFFVLDDFSLFLLEGSTNLLSLSFSLLSASLKFERFNNLLTYFTKQLN
jgi:hypothetical protein